jgi:hypothetical protein
MTCRRFALLVALAALAATTVAAAPAQGAKRKVPFGFFGTVFQPEFLGISETALDGQMSLMTRSGVESLRVSIPWAAIEPSKGAYDWAATDRVVRTAANHRLSLLANVLGAPPWAQGRTVPNYPSGTPPKSPAEFAEFVRQAVLRYGPRGTFWTQNPSLPRVPVRQWQIWNEQMAPWFWSQRPWGPSYTRVLKAAYRAIHRADRGATVVAGSLVAISRYSQWRGMRDLYRAGAKPYFDVVAVHPFTNVPNSARYSVEQVLEIVRRVRAQMRKRGDGRKPIILTELTWPAAIGKVPRQRLLGLETTSRGQLARLKAVYRRLAVVRRTLGITRAYWYTWASQYDANSHLADVSYRFAGLVRWRNNIFTPMPILKAYARLARHYEGCRKRANARRCS